MSTSEADQSKDSKRWQPRGLLRRKILHFTPSWYLLTMGTGITSILLHQLPFQFRGLGIISIAIYIANIILFITITVFTIVRYILYPETWTLMLRHSTQSLFLGAAPMGLATIVNMTVFVAVPAFGQWAITLAWVLWWIDVVLSVLICFGIPVLAITIHETAMDAITGVVLLPIVSTIVAAASGSIVANVLTDTTQAHTTLTVSYILLGTGLPLAMLVMVLYYQRLILYHIPPAQVIVSAFLPLGPLGQGSFAIQNLGKVAMKTNFIDARGGEVFYYAGILCGLILWGYGTIWLIFATAAIAARTTNRIPFNIGWWGFTFPLGVFTTATTALATDLPSRFFKYLGTILSVTETLLWIIVSLTTIVKVIRGELFFAPCLNQSFEKFAKAEKRSK